MFVTLLLFLQNQLYLLISHLKYYDCNVQIFMFQMRRKNEWSIHWKYHPSSSKCL